MFIVKRKTYRSVPRLSGTYLLFSFLPNVSQEIVEICMATFLGRQKHWHFTLRRGERQEYLVEQHQQIFTICSLFNSFVLHCAKDLVCLVLV